MGPAHIFRHKYTLCGEGSVRAVTGFINKLHKMSVNMIKKRRDEVITEFNALNKNQALILTNKLLFPESSEKAPKISINETTEPLSLTD